MKKNNVPALFSLLTVVTVMGSLTACGSKNSGQDFAQVQENTLEREWLQMGCTSSGDMSAFGASRKISLVLLEDKNLSRVETYYTANNCTDPAVTVTYGGKYTKNPSSEVDGNLDLNFNRVVIKPINKSGLAALSSLKWCGQTEWYVGVDVDVTTNGRSSSCSHPTMPLTVQNRYRVENGYLYLGSAALSSDTRPATVDRSDPYHCPCGR